MGTTRRRRGSTRSPAMREQFRAKFLELLDNIRNHRVKRFDTEELWGLVDAVTTIHDGPKTVRSLMERRSDLADLRDVVDQRWPNKTVEVAEFCRLVEMTTHIDIRIDWVDRDLEKVRRANARKRKAVKK